MFPTSPNKQLESIASQKDACTEEKDIQTAIAQEVLPEDFLEKKLPKGNRFILKDCLGKGGICEVYRALDLERVQIGDTTPEVALKVLLPEYAENPHARRMLAQEFFKLRHISLDGVVRVHDLHQHKGSLALSMELLKGKSLSSFIASGGMGLAGLPLVSAAMQTLAQLHTLGVVHADIKPDNIYVESGSRIVFLDFNMSLLSDDPGLASMPLSTSAANDLHLPAYSPRYASPKLISGEIATKADDIFSICCVAYELLTGSHPFKGQNSQQAQEKALEPEKPSFLNFPLWHELKKGLSFTPELRPIADRLANVFKPCGAAFSWALSTKNAIYDLVCGKTS